MFSFRKERRRMDVIHPALHYLTHRDEISHPTCKPMKLRTYSVTALVLGALLCLTALPATAQDRDNSEPRASPNARVAQTIGTTQITMHYGRPGVKGREIFGGLVPWDEAWRAGANEPTTITFSDDVQIEGQSLEAGTYNIFIRPSESGPWNVIFTTTVDWGTMFDQADPVLEVSVPAEDAPMQEWLMYRFENLSENSAELVMHWAEVRLPVTISTAS